MATGSMTTVGVFSNNYLTKNGYIGDETVLNAAPNQVKEELSGLWMSLYGGNDTSSPHAINPTSPSSALNAVNAGSWG